MRKKRMTRGQRQALAVLARILRDFYASEEAKG
jgi:predicted RNA polymerase sigma factor